MSSVSPRRGWPRLLLPGSHPVWLSSLNASNFFSHGTGFTPERVTRIDGVAPAELLPNEVVMQASRASHVRGMDVRRLSGRGRK